MRNQTYAGDTMPEPNLLLQSPWILTIISGLVVGFMILWLEHRSPWFAKRSAASSTGTTGSGCFISSLIVGVLAVGIPTGFVLVRPELITESPGRTLALGIVYALLALGLLFLVGIGSKLEGRWIDRAGEVIDGYLQGILSGYDRRYLQHLTYRCRDFDVKGLSTQGAFTLELERIFVELNLAPQPPHRASTDPTNVLPQSLRNGSHTI